MPAPSTTKNVTQTEKPPVLQAFSMYGLANQDGIVFTSLNGIATAQNPLSSIFGTIFSPAIASHPAQINSHGNQAAVASTVTSVQAPGQIALTFAPLSTDISSSTASLPIGSNQRPLSIRPPIQPSMPSVFSPSMASSSNHYVVTRPENQCGLSNVTKSRVVGGDITQIGKSRASTFDSRATVFFSGGFRAACTQTHRL